MTRAIAYANACLVRWWSAALSGAVVGAVAHFVLPPEKAFGDPHMAALRYEAVIFAALGALAGITFVIARKRFLRLA